MSADVTQEQSSAASVADSLRQMLAVLEQERQALAGLEIDGLLASSASKELLCQVLSPVEPSAIDEECRGLLRSAREMNDVNRKVRNLLAANVASRLEALTGTPGAYLSHMRQHA